MTVTPKAPKPPKAPSALATVPDLLAAAAARTPDAVAVRDEHGAWTYAELAAAAGQVAAWLAGQGVGRGERVLARIGNCREFVALLFGTLQHGAAFVPVNRGMKRFHLAGVLTDSEPVVVVAEPDDVGNVAGLTDRPVLALPDLWAQVGRLAPAAPAAIAADDLALLIYTSGSTSTPKAVVSPHAPVVFAAQAIAKRLTYRADDVVLTAIPLPFDYGLYQIFLSALAGAELVLSNPDSHVRLVGLLHEHRVTVVPVVPSLGEMLVRLSKRDNRATAVRLFTNTGAALTAPLIAALRAAFPTAQVAPMFGTTECKRITVLEPDGDIARPGSVGRALDGTQVLILDEDGTPLPPNEIGEICVRGPHVMAGYWRAPEVTAQRFRRDPATGEVTLHTGDYGHLDADGHLYFQGRRDDLFKRRGVRMSAIEIEAAVLDIPGVTAAAVLPPAGGHDLALFVVGDLPAAEVIRQLAERLEDAKVPPVATLLPALPTTPNGKTDKHRLAELRDAAPQAA